MSGHTIGTTTRSADTRRLPLARPQRQDAMSVAEALARRHSVRAFKDEPLSGQQVAQLCWAAQGIAQSGDELRVAPSAGGLYPMTVYVVRADGVYQYVPAQHELRAVLEGDVRPRLQAAALDQTCVGQAPLCLVIVMQLDRSARKYGRWAQRYCLMEAGHIAQNVLLQATAMGLGGTPVGAFEEHDVAQILKLPAALKPVYLIPLGIALADG